MLPDENICGVLLAGGQSRRIGGGDKCLAELGGKTLLQRSVDVAAPQVSQLVLNTNSDPGQFVSYGLPIVRDVVGGFAGPLAGVLTGMEWARENAPACEWLASFACDAPFVPTDLVALLLSAARSEVVDLACASSAGRTHPVFALWPLTLAADLRKALTEEGSRKVDIWTARYRLAVVDFDAEDADPFFNLNRPEDLAAAENHLEAVRA